MTLRKIQGFLLVSGPERLVQGVCNRTGQPSAGSVLVTASLEPSQYDAMMTARAVVCCSGGTTGHLQSICRARGIPVLRVDAADFDSVAGEVTIDLDRQTVTVGPNPFRGPGTAALRWPESDDLGLACAVITDSTDIGAINASGQGPAWIESFFIREEFLCLAAGLRPLDSLCGGRTDVEAYGRAIADQLCSGVTSLLPGQRLILRLLDLRSDDAARLTERASVPIEPNPELGLHGTRWLLRSTTYPAALSALLARLRARLGDEATRISLSAPFLNDAEEFETLRSHLGLSPDVAMSAFIETPAAVHATTALCAAGATELFVGTKDLVQFYLAADRGNHLVAHSYQTRHPAVLDGLRRIVEAALGAGTPVRVFALGADLEHYLEHLPAPTGYMMCTAELLALGRPDHGRPAWTP